MAPKNASAYALIAQAYNQQNQTNEAQSSYHRAHDLDPDSHFNLAHIHLLTGNYEAGWQEYEWRFKRAAVSAPILTLSSNRAGMEPHSPNRPSSFMENRALAIISSFFVTCH